MFQLLKEINMSDVVEISKSPQQLALEAKAAEEARLAAQTEFDPKLHGGGVHPAMGPQSVAELTKFVMELAQRVAVLEATPAATPVVPPQTAASTLKGQVK